MGVSMDFLMNLIQLGLDAGILALCCEVVFRQRAEIKAKDFFIFPILLVPCLFRMPILILSWYVISRIFCL